MLKQVMSGLLIGMFVLLSGQSWAAVIEFNPLGGQNGDVYHGHEEAGFTVSQSGGWFEGHVFGNDAPSVFSFESHNSIHVNHTDWSGFTFGGVDLACNNGDDCGYTVEGFLDSVSVLNISGTVTAGPPFEFFTVATCFGSIVLDFITITMNLAGGTSFNVDNINVTAVDVAGPGVFGLLLVGMSALGFARRN